MPNKPFELCKVCRVNHNQGKGHRYSARHQQRLASLLSSLLLKSQDISFFLHNPAFLRAPDRPLNSFWCFFCEAKITEDESVFVCSNTIRHLASPSHLEAVKKFWYVNGADVEKRHLYVIRIEELAKDGNNNDVTALQNFEKRSLVDCRSDACETVSVSQSHGAHAQMSSNILDQHEGLTCIRFSSSSTTEGNVHTGAPPPWLQIDDSKISSENNVLHQKGVAISRAKERRLQKLRNPKRVGAAWADKRRAEMEMEKAGNCLQRGFEGDKGWLPNFGRVWQSGSRRETRKEYEAEKWPGNGLEASKPEKPKAVQPYISKRQRLENANMQPSS